MNRPGAFAGPLERIDGAHRWIQAASPVRAHVFVMGLLFVSALIAAALLLPGDSERIAMLERDGKTFEARQILEQRFKAGDQRQHTLFQLEGLYEQSGNLAKVTVH